MNSIPETNKAAWEEAFSLRVNGFGDNHAQRLQTEPFPFLQPVFIHAVRSMRLEGASIGHFCCNNGRELMSLVKNTHAAEGVGFDIAANILAQARGIAAQTGIPCTFVEGDVCETAIGYPARFDLLLVTIGALCWMEHVDVFFQRTAECLKPGGRLLVYEIHPVSDMFALPEESSFDSQNPTKIVNSYFRKEPFEDCLGMGYLAGKTYESKPFISFNHTLGEIVTGIAQNGLVIEKLTEFDHDIGGNTEALEGMGVPLSYLLIARKG